MAKLLPGLYLHRPLFNGDPILESSSSSDGGRVLYAGVYHETVSKKRLTLGG